MSKTPRSKKLRHRPSRSIAASIVAIILLAVGVAAVWLSVIRLSTGSWPDFVTTAAGWAGQLAWNSPGMWAIAIGAVVIGLVLLLAALMPGKFNGMMINPGHHEGGRTTEVMLTGRAAERLASAHAGRMDGVTSSKATAKGRRVRLKVTSPLREPGDLRQRVAAAVRERLESADLEQKPKVAVRVRSADD